MVESVDEALEVTIKNIERKFKKKSKIIFLFFIIVLVNNFCKILWYIL